MQLPKGLDFPETGFSEVRIAPVRYRKSFLDPSVSPPDNTLGAYYGFPIGQAHRTGAAPCSRKLRASGPGGSGALFVSLVAIPTVAGSKQSSALRRPRYCRVVDRLEEPALRSGVYPAVDLL
jgi:hypothetical protein